MQLRNLKGTQDFLPEEQILRESIIDTLKVIFKRYGFNPLETPVLEFYDILASKYAGGEEILKETYKLKDQGKRELSLRYDLTVPFARLIGMNPELRMPFKRYEIGKVFRDGPVKLGRLREFWQCDIDVVGNNSMIADAEMIAITFDAFKELGLDVYVEVNNRKLLSGIIESVGIPKAKSNDVLLSVDKLKKIGEKGVKGELKEKGIDESYFKKLFSLLKISGDYEKVLKDIESKVNNEKTKEGIKELRELFGFIKKLKIKGEAVLNLSLARGLDIYTGTVFEGFLKNNEISYSVCGGGRWDAIIGNFLGSKQKYPAVGLSFGLDVIYTALKLDKKTEKKSVLQVYVIPINTLDESLKIVAELRKKGIAADLDALGKNLSKNLDFANKQGIPFVIILGQKELAEKRVTVRDMKSGKEEKVATDKIAEYFTCF